MNNNNLSKKTNNNIFWSIFILTILIRIWIIAGIPKMYIYGPHDDLYYAKMAHSLIHHQWMGSYNQMTLIKMPFYGFFLVLSSLTGQSLLLNETFFYIIACITLFFAISPLISNLWSRYSLFTILLFMPASLATSTNIRIYREFTDISLTLYFISFSIGLFLRLYRKITTVCLWAIGFGLSSGAFLISREESLWIYPFIFIVTSVSLISIWKGKISEKLFRSILIISQLLFMMIPTWMISFQNEKYYGYYGVSEQLSPEFNLIINTLGRIKTSKWLPYSPITKETVELASQVSPLFAELEFTINNMSPGWQIYADQLIGNMPSWYRPFVVEGEGLGNYFNWMLRNALAENGYYSDGKYPKEKLKALAEELEMACENGKLECYPLLNIPMVTSIRPEHFIIISHFFIYNIKCLLEFRGVPNVASLDLSTWPAYDSYFEYFDEFAYNPITYNYFGTLDGFNLIDNRHKINILLLNYKEIIMKEIQKFYTQITFSIAIVFIIIWLVYLIFFLTKYKRISTNYRLLFIIIFVFSLLSGKILLLSIISATTNMWGITYASSCYVFLYILLFFLGVDIKEKTDFYRKSVKNQRKD